MTTKSQLAELKELDHSSLDALMVDMNRHLGCVFRFIINEGENRQPSLTSEWRLGGEVTQVRIGSREMIAINIDGGCACYSLEFGWLSHKGLRLLRVAIKLPQLNTADDADAVLRRKLNKNLRGVFS